MNNIFPFSLRYWLQRLERRRTARFWGSHSLHNSQDFSFWLAIDHIMHWVNRKVSGYDHIWPLSWFLMSLPPNHVPVRHAVSIGCGAGNLEREVIRHNSASHITAIDISTDSLTVASRLAEDAGYLGRITYCHSDAETWLRNESTKSPIDLIFFHASLHHIRELETVLGLCAERLRHSRPGLLYADEYIGPSRHEWHEGHLGFARSLFQYVPLEFRQSESLRPPVAYQDPSEMVRSSEIECVLRNTFDILEYKPYFGNVVMPLVSGIRPSGLLEPQVKLLIDEAMQLEDYLVSRSLFESMHSVFVCRPA